MKKIPSVSMIIGAVFCSVGLISAFAGIGITLFGSSIGEKDNMMLFLYIFGGIGLLFFLIGLPFLISGIKRRNNIKRVLETGEQATGIIKDVVRNLRVTVNNRHPYKAECEVVDPVTGEIYLYSSENVMRNIDHLKGRSVTVYYDPDDRRVYYVDIESAENDYCANEPAVHDYR